jgi:hypothetical protein
LNDSFQPLLMTAKGRELPLSEFITVKPPLEFRFPEAALRY